MLVGHGLLHRVNFLPTEMLDCQYLLAIYHAEENDAGIGRQVTQALIMNFADEDGAGAAITFSAAFFGAGQAGVGAKVIQQGQIWVGEFHLGRLRPEQKTNAPSGILHSASLTIRRHQLPR